ALLLAGCLLVQCGRSRAGQIKKVEQVAPIPKVTVAAAAKIPAAKSRSRPEPDSRIGRLSRLSNGILVATEAFRVETGDKAFVSVTVGIGSRHETEQLNGLAHFTEHML
ncbi:hypothetical protein PMAYCL1PPCAC_10968, partial [Pristionchus mayeri]